MLQEAQQGERRDRKRPSTPLSAHVHTNISSHPPLHYPEIFTKTHVILSSTEISTMGIPVSRRPQNIRPVQALLPYVFISILVLITLRVLKIYTWVLSKFHSYQLRTAFFSKSTYLYNHIQNTLFSPGLPHHPSHFFVTTKQALPWYPIPSFMF